MLSRLFKSRHSFASVLIAVILCGVLMCNAVLPVLAVRTTAYTDVNNGETHEDEVAFLNEPASQSNYDYTIRYDANPEYIGKTDSDVFSLTGSSLPMLNSQHIFGEWKKLNKNDYGIKGYKFVGWNTRPDGQGTIEDLVAEVTVSFYVESSDGNVDMISSAVYKVGEPIVVPSDPLHWSVNVSTKEDSNHFTYTFEKWENISGNSAADIDYRSGTVVASHSVNYLAKFQKDTVSWFIKGDSSTVKASTGIAANDNWVQVRYNEALANSNVPTGQLVLYPTNAGLQSAKGLSLIGTLDSQSGVGSAPWYSKASSIKSVYVRPGVRANASAQGLFADLTLATAMDVSNLNTTLVTNFHSMFLNAESVKTINVTGLNTSAGTNFANMFDDCYVVTKITGIESFDVSKATTMELMFSECKKLASLNLSSWNTSKVKNFRGTFSGMHSLKFNESIGNLNTASATNMSMMFQYCLQFVDIAFGSRFVTNNVTDMSGMFNYCEKLVEIDMSYFNTRKVNNFNKVASNNTTPIFDSCPSLAIIHVGANFGFKGDGSTTVSGGLNGYLPNPQDAHYAEINSTSQGYWFADSDGDKFMYNNIPSYVSGGETYRIYKSYAALYKNNADATDLTLVLGRTAADTAPDTYNGAQRYLTIWNIETVEYAAANDVGWSAHRGKVTEVVAKDIIKPKNMGCWFYNFTTCMAYDLEKLDTSDCVAFNHLFYGNSSATGIDVSMFNTSSGTLFQGMFYNCANVKELDLSSFDMRKATNTNNLFAGMNKLQAVHFGANWKWVSSGGYLPNQIGIISGADGKWHASSGTAYAPSNVPAGAGSYYATSSLATAAATLAFDDDTSATLSDSIAILQPESNVEYTNDFDRTVASLYVENNVSLISIDGSLVDPDEILFFQDQESVNNLTDASGGVITLYAIWRPIEYTIHYNQNGTGVTGEMPNSLFIYNTTSTLAPVAFERTGYEFSGWATEPRGGVVYEDEAEILNLTDTDGVAIELYAVWTPIEYTIHYNPNGDDVTGEMPDSSHVYDTPSVLSPVGFERDGYDFSGWATEPGGETVYDDEAEIQNLTDTSEDTVELYAVWTPVEYTIHYNPNGTNVTGEMSNSVHVYDTPSTLLPVGFEREGYEFSGWATEPGGEVVYGDKAEILNLTDISGDTVELYAIWERIAHTITYTITYDGNGATGGDTPDSIHVFGVPQKLTENGYYKTGYEFLGWSTNPDGSGTFYPDQSYVENLSSVDGDVIVLYAKWVEKSAPSSNFTAYLRFIKKNYLDTLLPRSKWLTESLNGLLRSVLENDLSDTSSCEQVWEFSADEFEDVQKWCREREKGSDTNKEFLDFFGTGDNNHRIQ